MCLRPLWLLPLLLCGATSEATGGVCTAVPTRGFAERVADLRAWLTERGGHVNSKVQVSELALGDDAAEGTGRGLVAVEDIAEGELLVSVPAASIVTSGLAFQNELCKEAYDIMITEREKCTSCSRREEACRRTCAVLAEANRDAVLQLVIALWLRQQFQNNTSEWRPWLEMLPRDWASSLLALPEHQLRAALQGTPVLKEALQRRNAWHIAHGVLHRESAAYRAFVPSHESLLVGRLLVLSRMHGLELAGGEDGLVPFADLLNHEVGAPTIWRLDDNRGFQLLTTMPVTKGRQITVSYGDDRDNNELILHYGFVMPENQAHTVPVFVTLDSAKKDALHHVKRGALVSVDRYRGFQFGMSKGFAHSGAPLVFMGWGDLTFQEKDQELFGEMLTNLRVAVMNEEDVQSDDLRPAMLDGDEDALELLKKTHAISTIAVESRAAARLETICAEALSMLGSSDAAERLLQMQATQEDQGLGQEPSEGDSGSDSCGMSLGVVDIKHVASTAAALVALERRLYGILTSVAHRVQNLIVKGLWPSTDITDDAELESRYVALWASIYAADLRALAPASKVEP